MSLLEQQIFDLLKEVAHRREVITYSELVRNLEIPDSFKRHIGPILGELNRKLHTKNLPLITAVVVNSETGMPGKGFFELAMELGRLQRGESWEEFWQKEREMVYRVFGE